MKTLMATAAAAVLIAGIAGANAQNMAAPGKSDKTIHQSAGDRDSRGGPKRYTQTKMHRNKSTMRASQFDSSIHQSAGERDSRGTPKGRTTTGSAPRVNGAPGSLKNDPSIHQSIGTDSRGGPKQ
jgi:hypothetical protein